LDEKWSFVAKKQPRCDLQDQADHVQGDCWDHIAFDPEHRLVLGVEFGKRSGTKILALLKRVKEQLQGRVPRLVTSDEFAPYARVLKQVWPRQRERSAAQRSVPRPPAEVDPALVYATVCKTREHGRVTSVRRKTVFGTDEAVAAALRESTVSRSVNTSFLERHNGTDRHHNARKARRTYRFSKDWLVHQAVGCFTLYAYNFCWKVRTLAEPVKRRSRRAVGAKWRQRTPAMAAGLTDHVWSLQEWLRHPIAGLST
jgi:IS1 family transposase